MRPSERCHFILRLQMRSKSAGGGWETGAAASGAGGVLLPSILGVFLGRPELSGASGFPDVWVRIWLFRGPMLLLFLLLEGRNSPVLSGCTCACTRCGVAVRGRGQCLVCVCVGGGVRAGQWPWCLRPAPLTWPGCVSWKEAGLAASPDLHAPPPQPQPPPI